MSYFWGRTVMLSGMHEILHIVDCTINFGSINYVNCFPYDEINRKIVYLINGFDLVGVEFIMNFSILQSLQVFSESYRNNTRVNKFIEKHNIIKTSNKKRVNQDECILSHLQNITDHQFKIVTENLIVDGMDRSEMKSCKRIKFHGSLYTTTKNKSKRADHCVRVELLYGLISDFIVIKNEIYVAIQRVDHLFSPFYDENNPQIQSNTFLCIINYKK